MEVGGEKGAEKKEDGVASAEDQQEGLRYISENVKNLARCREEG